MNNVVDIKQPICDELLVGPFEEYRVKVDGRIIPDLTGFPEGDDRTTLIVDRRFSATFFNEDARQAAWLIAQALAIGHGYPSMSAESKNHPFAPIGMEIRKTS